MFVFAYFIIFNFLGRDYDAAILSAGSCGFGMGATPNAMANMQVLTGKFAPSVKAYILVPIVGSMFVDFINSLTITFFNFYAVEGITCRRFEKFFVDFDSDFRMLLSLHA